MNSKSPTYPTKSPTDDLLIEIKKQQNAKLINSTKSGTQPGDFAKSLKWRESTPALRAFHLYFHPPSQTCTVELVATGTLHHPKGNVQVAGLGFRVTHQWQQANSALTLNLIMDYNLGALLHIHLSIATVVKHRREQTTG
jgi:hypothetical protein